MADRTVELDAAVYQALTEDAGVTAIVGTRVWHDVPPGTPVPYVAIGDHQAQDYGGALVDAQGHTTPIDCWTEGPSPLGCRQLVAAIRAVLHGADLALSAGRLVNCRVESTQTLRDPDGISHHGVLRIRAVTHD